MVENEKLIRDLYPFAEGPGTDPKKFVSSFSEDGYMRDVPAGLTLRGEEIGGMIAVFAAAFPDLHRELFSVYVADSVVVVELAIRGTHQGVLALPSGSLAPTGRIIDVPCCDVFHLKDGKIISFHCYNAASVMQQQLGLTTG